MDFSEIIGNNQMKEQLSVAALAAKLKCDAIPHLLFGGPPGTGKTTMANALAAFTGVPFFQVDAASIKTAEDVFRITSQFPLDGYDIDTGVIIGDDIVPAILFIDEIHNLPLKGQEHLGIAMENNRLAVCLGRGKQARNVVVFVPKFTLIGATTMTGRLSKPLRDRFKLQFRFETYSHNESVDIIFTHAKKLGTSITTQAAELIACRGRGIGRILVRFLEQARDMNIVLQSESPTIDVNIVLTLFDRLGINNEGFDKQDRLVLEALYKNRSEPVGLDSLAVLLNESPATISSEVEPYLIIKGLMLRTSKGRTLTDAGLEYVKTHFFPGEEKNTSYDRFIIKD